MHALKGDITCFVDDALLEEPLARELGRAGEKLLKEYQWIDAPTSRAPVAVRIRRVRNVGAGAALLYVEVERDRIDVIVDRSLMRPLLPSLLTQAAALIGRNFI